MQVAYNWSRWVLPFDTTSKEYWKWYFEYESYWIRWWYEPYTPYWLDLHIGQC